jgi:hypothetical protein
MSQMIFAVSKLAYFTDINLEPYSVYEYSVDVVNSAGGTRSSIVNTRTLTALPTGVDPPEATVDPSQLYVIYLTWEIPQKPNGCSLFFYYTILLYHINVYH